MENLLIKQKERKGKLVNRQELANLQEVQNTSVAGKDLSSTSHIIKRNRLVEKLKY